MDSEHRHELKENALAKWIADAPEHIKNVPTYIKKNPWESACILLIVIGGLGLIRNMIKPDSAIEIKDVRNQAAVTSDYQQIPAAQNRIRAGADTSGALLALSESIEEKVALLDTPAQKALAMIKAGDALRSDLHYRKGEVADETTKDQIALAQEKYEKAFDLAKKNVTVQAMAKYGLALCAEEIRDFDAAKAFYKEIAANEEYKITPFAVLAQNRLETIGDSMATFQFVKAEPVQLPAETAPAEETK